MAKYVSKRIDIEKPRILKIDQNRPKTKTVIDIYIPLSLSLSLDLYYRPDKSAQMRSLLWAFAVRISPGELFFFHDADNVFPAIIPFMPNGLFYLYFLDWSISNRWGIWLVFIIIIFVEIPISNANSVDFDQAPRLASVDFMGRKA